jgi:hypothetical protein
VLWLIGLPAGSVDNDLSVRLACVDGHTGEMIYQQTYSAEHYHETFWIYAMPNDFNYPNMLKEIYGKFIGDLITNEKCT